MSQAQDVKISIHQKLECCYNLLTEITATVYTWEIGAIKDLKVESLDEAIELARAERTLVKRVFTEAIKDIIEVLGKLKEAGIGSTDGAVLNKLVKETLAKYQLVLCGRWYSDNREFQVERELEDYKKILEALESL